ncbi:TonB-dependent receptor plug domain-containing protein [Odoribacter lunatus]|uniref:TonB-dependent receptor plug domain-containing protein n=1 Tax=Odoribacter lunatus TaxID=2941335 RepID=UPI00203A92F6|nr:TonB-dependent receptor [Odoribacter lunatus]
MSALYGAQAMGGVVNIITKNADRPFTADLSARVGSRDEMKYSASVGTKLNRFSSYTTFSYRKSDPYEVEDQEGQVQEVHGRDSVWRDTSARGSSVVLGYDVWSLNERLGYSFTDALKAEMSVGYYRNNLQNPYELDGIQDRFSTLTINPKLNYLLDENHLLTFSYMLDNYVKKEVYSDGFPDRKTMQDLTNTARLNYSGKLAERHTLTAGVEVNTQKMHHYWFDDNSLLDYTQQNYVLYVQEEWKANEAFSLVAGVRSDCHSHYGFHPSPNISLMYRWAGLSLRGGYGMGFRLPTLKELHSAYPMGGFGFMIYGNEDLKPEESHQGTLSVEYTKGVFNGSVSGYYTKYRNEIYLGTYEEEDGTLAQKYYNHESSRKTGVDVMGQVRLDGGFTLNASYSYVNTHADREGYNTSVFRPHSLTFTANYARQVGKVRTSAALNGRWLSKVDVWNKDDDGNYVLTPYYAYTSVDLNLGARFPRGFRLALGLNNLMNFKAKNAATDSSVIPQRGIEVVGTLGINLADLLKL